MIGLILVLAYLALTGVGVGWLSIRRDRKREQAQQVEQASAGDLPMVGPYLAVPKRYPLLRTRHSKEIR